jgi:hypothetical protein
MGIYRFELLEKMENGSYHDMAGENAKKLI